MVELGCERLFADPRAFCLVGGRRVGLVTNPSGVDRGLRATADVLHASPGVELVMLFGPEHGIRGDAEDGVPVETAVDGRTGVPAVSLYGERRAVHGAARAVLGAERGFIPPRQDKPSSTLSPSEWLL